MSRCPHLAAALLLAGTTTSAFAQTRWQKIGTTNIGNPVELDTRTVKRANGIVSATIRSRFVKAAKTPAGPVTSSRTVIRVDCAKRMVAIPENVYYHDEAKNVVYQRSVVKMAGYAPPMGGSAPDLAVTYLCKP